MSDQSTFGHSAFTLTFAVEILDIDVWHDCQEGWVDLGPCLQGVKFQYSMYPGTTCDVECCIWPHAVMVYSAGNSNWVRTWQFLDRRWFCFSIRHLLSVRALELREHNVVITPSFGLGALSSAAKSDSKQEVFMPPLEFGTRRYFGEVLLQVPSEKDLLIQLIRSLIWKCICEFLPGSPLDGVYDVPTVVTDKRHQDTVIERVQEIIVGAVAAGEESDSSASSEEIKMVDKGTKTKKPASKMKEISKSKETIGKNSAKKKETFELSLSGDAILAGVGRVVAFEVKGERPSGVGEVMTLISSTNLPAHDDYPTVFINVNTLFDVPMEEMRKLKISSLYTRWILGEEIHDSQQKSLTEKKFKKLSQGNINFNDHHAIPIPPDLISEVTSTFLEGPYEIQLRGTKFPSTFLMRAKFFGYDPNDRDFSASKKNFAHQEELDFLIATTKIDGARLAKGVSTFIRGEYSMEPISLSIPGIGRERMCTNDINHIRGTTTPKIVVPSDIILRAHMTLEASIGLVGCKPRRLQSCYSRMFMLLYNGNDTLAIVAKINKCNEITSIGGLKPSNELLTGICIDTGTVAFLFVEGPRDGAILEVWELTEDHPQVKIVYSSSARYFSRIYSDFIINALPFVVFKMYANINILLACPAVYARPALPLPARAALLKLNRIIAGRLLSAPPRCLMPTTEELRSFRLELCVPPRPPLFLKRRKSINEQQEEYYMDVLTEQQRAFKAMCHKSATKLNQLKFN